MNNLPVAHPAETLAISPEALEIANCYLELQSIDKVVDALDCPRDIVVSTLDKREVRAYVDQVFINVGFNSRFEMRHAMDAIIRKKFQELEESETGSSKDIADLLALSHKMTMDELDRQIKLEQVRAGTLKTQVNIQNNGTDPKSNYNALLDRLLA